MIVNCKGFVIDDFKIPSFQLKKGEVIGINRYNNSDTYSLINQLALFLEGKKSHQNISTNQPITFANYVKESRLKAFLKSTTVSEFLFNQKESIEKLQALDSWITPNTKMNMLDGNARKWVAILKAFSQTSNIIFELAGQDPEGIQKTMGLVRGFVNEGASAILFDYWEEALALCTRTHNISRTDEEKIYSCKNNFMLK